MVPAYVRLSVIFLIRFINVHRCNVSTTKIKQDFIYSQKKKIEQDFVQLLCIQTTRVMDFFACVYVDDILNSKYEKFSFFDKVSTNWTERPGLSLTPCRRTNYLSREFGFSSDTIKRTVFHLEDNALNLLAHSHWASLITKIATKKKICPQLKSNLICRKLYLIKQNSLV